MIGVVVRRGLGALAALFLLVPVAATATPTDRIIIKVAESMRPAMLADGAPAPRARARVSALSAATGRDIAWLRAMSGGADVLVLSEALPEEEVAALAADLARMPGVEYAVPDRRVFPMLEPNDPGYGDQWYLQDLRTTGSVNYSIDAPAAWDLVTGDAVTVAVVDTGIRFTHADLIGKVLPGHDFVREDFGGVIFTANDGDGRDPVAADPGDWITSVEAAQWACDPRDSSWHGTHMAGIIAAATDNGTGVAGVSWGAMILPVRALGKCGGYDSDVIDGIRWAAGVPDDALLPNAHPAQVINLSLGRPGDCEGAWQDAVTDARAEGALVVGAAGNSGENLDSIAWTPASCNGVLIVTASYRNGMRPLFANYGSAVAISAPGFSILSTADAGRRYPLQDSWDEKSGTSVSTAVVSGVAALVLSRDPGLTPHQVRGILTDPDNVTPFPADSDCDLQEDTCGTGIINAALAVAAADETGPRPEAFSFETATGAGKGDLVTSETVTVATGEGPLEIEVTAGSYSVGCDDGSFTDGPGTIEDGENVCVRHAASAYPDHPAATVLTVGNHRASFVSMTVPADTTPDTMPDFLPRSGVSPGAVVTSETITVTGIDAPTPVQVSGDDADTNSRYSLNCVDNGFTTEPGYIAPGGSICVRHTASAERGGEAVTTLTIGGQSVSFATTTRTSSGGGGALGAWFLAALLVYAGARRRRRVANTSPVSAP